MTSSESIDDTTGLVTYQALWGLQSTAADPARIGPDASLAAVAAAGFDGIAVSHGFGLTEDEVEQWTVRASRAGLRSCLGSWPPDGDVDAAIRLAARAGADALVLCGPWSGGSADQAVERVATWIVAAEGSGVTLHLETHRGTITDDLHLTVELLDQLPDLVLSGDLSHPVVGHGLEELMGPPVDSAASGAIDRIVGRCGSIQGRIATANQVQVPLDWPSAQPWVERFRAWWAEGFRARPRPNRRRRRDVHLRARSPALRHRRRRRR